ncbi:hypothetical protein B7R22_05705 [Subtercola boreus]|uniref:DUF805 domain-containing protein n=1 Tax=Subtercola boreus TaxID=120213 RepID=A0A3E0W0J8_9MICO|nr:DUF805 domain-containing protein [Subtercola boreus]RFA15894.1 hypothetical protein B7R22_05705 [Subtercola boreus]
MFAVFRRSFLLNSLPNAPLWAPFYGAPFGAAVRRFFTKYATFSGRAGRAEYWWVALFTGVVSLVLQIILATAGGLNTNMNGTVNTPTGAAIFITVVYAGASPF